MIAYENVWKEANVAQFEAYPEIYMKVRSETKQAQKCRSRSRDLNPESVTHKAATNSEMAKTTFKSNRLRLHMYTQLLT